MITCEQCHSRVALSSTLSSLSPSAFHFINQALGAPGSTGRGTPAAGPSGSRSNTAYAAGHSHLTSQSTVLESFILVKPTPSSHPSAVSASPQLSTSLAQDPSGAPTSITASNARLNALFAMLSSATSIPSLASTIAEHPLCKDCVAQLLALMSAELETIKKERDRLIGFERDVKKRREEGEENGTIGKEGLKKEIAKLKKAEQISIQDLRTIEAERDTLDLEMVALDTEEAELALEEAAFWRSHSQYLLKAATIKDELQSLQTRYLHDSNQLDKLQRTNVYNDVFCIGQEGGLGTINGLRLGRLPNILVEWPEINAAWGHTLLLLFTIARKYGFVFETYRLIPMASFSRIEKIAGDKAVYELYGSGDFQLNRLLLNRRFDQAMVAFLDCLRQVMDFVKTRDRTVALPHSISKDRIGEVSIKLQFGSDEIWSRALRHVLLNLKILLAKVST